MVEPNKRRIALGVLAAWIVLFGVCFAEHFGYAEDNPEAASQSVEQALSLPADRVTYAADEVPDGSRSLAHLAMGDPSPCPLRADHRLSPRSSDHSPPSGTRLLHLFSTLRL